MTRATSHSESVRAVQRDAVFSSLLSAMRERVRYAELLAIEGDRAVGRGDIAGVSIPLTESSAFGRVAASASPFVGTIGAGEVEVIELLARMGGDTPGTAVLLPIVVRDRTVAIAVGHGGADPIEAEDISELLPLASATSDAIARVILANRRAATTRRRARTASPRARTERGPSDVSDKVEFLLGRAASCADVEDRADILGNVARVYESELGDRESAVAVREQIVRTLGNDIEDEAPETRADRYHLQADLLEHELHDDLRAIEAHRRALAADPASLYSLVSLERLYRRNEMWEQLLFALRRTADLRADDLGADERARIAFEIGQLCERLQDRDGAVQAYREAIAADPHDLDALAALAQIYETTGQAERYLDTVEAQLEATEELEDEHRELYLRVAEAWEEDFGRTDRATACLQKAIDRGARDRDTFRALIELYRGVKDWESLVGAYTTYIDHVEDPVARVDLYVAMAEVCRQLRAPEREIAAYRNVLEIDPEEPRALDALGTLYEQTAQHAHAVAVLSELLNASPEPHHRFDLHYRLGRVLLEGVGDPVEAEAHLAEALSLDPNHRPTLELMANLYRQQGRWRAAVDALLLVEPLQELASQRAELLYDAGRICLDELGDADQAADCFRAVLALDREHVDAARPLAELDFEAERWDELAPVADMLVRKAEPDPELRYLAAACALARGNATRAEKMLRRALELDEGHLEARRALAALLRQQDRPRDAAKEYETLWTRHRTTMADEDALTTLVSRGELYRELGDRRRAIEMFQGALAIDPGHRVSADAIVELQLDVGNFPAVIRARRASLNALAPEERAAALSEIGDLLVRRVGDREQAVASYREALELDDDAHAVRQKLLELYTEDERWLDAIAIIEQFIEREESPVRRGAYHRAAAAIYRDRLDDGDRAVEHLESALDDLLADPDLAEATRRRALEAFRAIDEIYTAAKAWKQQEQAYRRMIKRLAPGDPLLPTLWHSLGEVCRSRLAHYESAIGAFEVAKQLQPDHAQRNAILAELYALAGADHAADVIAQHRHILRLDPTNVDSYRALLSAYRDAQQHDRAWCVCEALVYLGKATATERRFRDTYRSSTCAMARHSLAEADWQRLLAPGADPKVSSVFERTWHDAARLYAQPHKAFGFKRKDRLRLDDDELSAVRAVRYLAPVLGIPEPDVFAQPDEPGDAAFAACLDGDRVLPTVVLRANLLRRQPAPVVMYRLAYLLTLMRPEFCLELVVPTCAEREAVLRAAAGGDAARLDVAKWGHAVRATARRAAFLLCGDLAAAAEIAKFESKLVGGPGATEKAHDLLLFSISDDYFALRERLGLTIGA